MASFSKSCAKITQLLSKVLQLLSVYMVDVLYRMLAIFDCGDCAKSQELEL